MKQNIFLGDIISIYEAQTRIERLKSKRGSGDIITTILVYLLKKKIIDNALVVKMSEKDPWKAEPFIAKTEEEIISARGSKYTFVPNHHLLNNLSKKSVLVGLPCQIRKCRDKDILKLGLFCGLNFSPRGLDYLLKYLKVKKEDVRKLEYRAPDTKAFVVELKDGQKREVRGYSSLAYFFTNKMCLFCKDYANHFADISVGDRHKDWSAVIIRTKRGNNIFKEMMENGYIKANKISKEDFLKKRMTPLMQKEKRGGFINTPLVRPRRKWVEYIPLRILNYIGSKIGRILK